MEVARDEWLKESGPESKSGAMLLDQLVAQPPRLLTMYVMVDLLRAALREIPTAWNRSWVGPDVQSAITLKPPILR